MKFDSITPIFNKRKTTCDGCNRIIKKQEFYCKIGKEKLCNECSNPIIMTIINELESIRSKLV